MCADGAGRSRRLRSLSGSAAAGTGRAGAPGSRSAVTVSPRVPPAAAPRRGRPVQPTGPARSTGRCGADNAPAHPGPAHGTCCGSPSSGMPADGPAPGQPPGGHRAAHPPPSAGCIHAPVPTRPRNQDKRPDRRASAPALRPTHHRYPPSRRGGHRGDLLRPELPSGSYRSAVPMGRGEPPARHRPPRRHPVVASHRGLRPPTRTRRSPRRATGTSAFQFGGGCYCRVSAP